MLATSPAGQIRQHLEQAGPLEVPFVDLLTTWNVEQPDARDREVMAKELSAAGVRTSRLLGELAPDDLVELSVVDHATRELRPAWLTTHQVPPVAAAPPSPPSSGESDSDPSGPKRRRLWLVLAIIATIAAVAGMAAGAFFVGQGTRMSDDEVASSLDRQHTRDVRAGARKEATALASQARKLRAQRRRAVAAANKRGRQTGYNSGHQAGYASGNSVGYSAGHSSGVEEGEVAGVQEGIDRASDELACSDDMDVALPMCN